jgi:parallel beta-helix repeat protein
MFPHSPWCTSRKFATFFALTAFCVASTAVSQATTITISPGANIPAVVEANPAGTKFVIKPGLYRLASPINAKTGDSFIGQTACAPPKTSCPAILSGSVLLTTFKQSGSLYYVADQTQQGLVTITTAQCQPKLPGYPLPYPGCIYPEDLYFDGQPLVHVTALADVVTGKWFFDYDTQTIYFYDDPTGHTVETSVTPSAFAWGPANEVTIQGLTVEEFASPIQRGAIAGNWAASSDTGIDWIVENNEILLNHGDGVKVNFGWQLLNNYIHNNGNLGIGGGLGSITLPSNVLIQGNEVSFNNYAHVSPLFAAGGSDLTQTLGVVFRGNYVHDNEGSGIWMDTQNTNTLYDGNIVEHNTEQGIFHEISDAAIIRNNTITGNGYIHPDGTFWLYGAGILSSSSQDVEAYCNTVEMSTTGGNGIDIIAQPRLVDDTESMGNHFHHNTVTFSGDSGFTGAVRGSLTDLCCVDLYTLNQFDYNSYHITGLTRKAFYWDDNIHTFADFQALGQETHGTADINYTGSIPAVAITAPVDQSTVSGVVTVQGTVKADIKKVEFYVDWALSSSDTASPFSFSWNTSGVTKGSHTIAAMAYNTAGTSACYAVTLNVQ